MPNQKEGPAPKLPDLALQQFAAAQKNIPNGISIKSLWWDEKDF